MLKFLKKNKEKISEKLLCDIEEYIDEHFLDIQEYLDEHLIKYNHRIRASQSKISAESKENVAIEDDSENPASEHHSLPIQQPPKAFSQTDTTNSVFAKYGMWSTTKCTTSVSACAELSWSLLFNFHTLFCHEIFSFT